MRASTLINVLQACHLARHVRSENPARGGIMLVAPAGSFKTSTMLRALRHHSGHRILSDANTSMVNAMIDDITTGKISTLAFADAQKIYERDFSTARNLEGSVRALMEEGWYGATNSPKGLNSFVAHCHVMWATTPASDRQHASRWIENGFARRWLHVMYRVDSDHRDLENAFIRSERIQFTGAIQINPPVDREYWVDVTDKDIRRWILKMCEDQNGPTETSSLLAKVYSVLAYAKGGKPFAKRTLEDLAPALKKGGAVLEL